MILDLDYREIVNMLYEIIDHWNSPLIPNARQGSDTSQFASFMKSKTFR